jgi:hypothetical protein
LPTILRNSVRRGRGGGRKEEYYIFVTNYKFWRHWLIRLLIWLNTQMEFYTHNKNNRINVSGKKGHIVILMRHVTLRTQVSYEELVCEVCQHSISSYAFMSLFF